MSNIKRVTVFGATGTVGTALVDTLIATGHRVTAASRSTGVDAITGDGIARALDGADILIDVTNSPVPEPGAAESFFTVAATNLTEAARKAAVEHYVLLSIVGVDGIAHLHGKQAQEKSVATSGLQYTIARATQFHEFAERITDLMIVSGEARVPDANIQPVAVTDVAAALARIADEPARNGIVDIAGPEVMTFADYVQAVLDARHDPATVIVDPQATYFGTALDRNSLLPAGGAQVTATRFTDWLTRRRQSPPVYRSPGDLGPKAL
ncbi:LysR family transcriptional regulator [Mycolicibacterium sp. 018/SC-01/001]|uniref:SDR family oxidoreductase n=1 Tax=Mycolicibacterium sp. 018/SC-01/001 TaxID=2592069 RepID=UPI00117D1484|nr:NAD(P)H-binding protein [Mycolicibacterium sp. 018/SC-01/001]TRW82083.1 LysR family transcriptional regulator [Mycolicibacterium sp. 018/SC-01/001]